MVGFFCIPQDELSTYLWLTAKKLAFLNEQYPEQSPTARSGSTRAVQNESAWADSLHLPWCPLCENWHRAPHPCAPAPSASSAAQRWALSAPMAPLPPKCCSISYLISQWKHTPSQGASLPPARVTLPCPHSLHTRSFLGLEWPLLSSYNLNYPSFAILENSFMDFINACSLL